LRVAKLYHRRRFLLAPQKLNIFDSWQQNEIDGQNYYLYTHPDLKTTEFKCANKLILLLGDLFDYKHPEYDNSEILKTLPVEKFDEFVESTHNLSGRFVIIYCDHDDIRILHDAAGMRKVYYTSNDSGNWCASHPLLLNEYNNLKKTDDKTKLEYYTCSQFYKANCCDITYETIFSKVYQLIPNYYLSLNSMKPERHWPTKKNIESSPDEVVAEASNILKGLIKSAGNRYKLMLPVTSGLDSRLLFAASVDSGHDIYYYISKDENVDINNLNIKTPRKLFDRLKRKFNIVSYTNDVDEDFKTIWNKTNLFGEKRNLSRIYNQYKHFSDRLNLPGAFSEVARVYYRYPQKEKRLDYILNRIHLKEYKYAQKKYKEWFNERLFIEEQYNYDIMDLFFWEERAFNFGGKGQADKDIAQEDYIPFNCCKLMEVLLSANEKYRIQHINYLHTEIIKYLYPDALLVPINPSLEYKAITLLKKLKIHSFLQRIVTKIK